MQTSRENPSFSVKENLILVIALFKAPNLPRGELSWYRARLMSVQKRGGIASSISAHLSFHSLLRPGSYHENKNVLQVRCVCIADHLLHALATRRVGRRKWLLHLLSIIFFAVIVAVSHRVATMGPEGAMQETQGEWLTSYNHSLATFTVQGSDVPSDVNLFSWSNMVNSRNKLLLAQIFNHPC